MNNDIFRAVYDSVIHGKTHRLNNNLLTTAIKLAKKNKVLLHYLRTIDIHSNVREIEELRFQRFINELNIVAKTLKGLEYIFIKLRKPVFYVPSDIDILIDEKQIPIAVTRLRNIGFNIEVIEPYTITMVRGNTIVDLYLYPTLGSMIYLDAKKLLEYKEITCFLGIEIPVLETYAEALMSIAHSVYKERLYTLNDYATVKVWFSNRSEKLAEELNCLKAVKEIWRINYLVEKIGYVLPYKIELPIWLMLLVEKSLIDPLTRATTYDILKGLKDQRLGKLLFKKIVIDTY